MKITNYKLQITNKFKIKKIQNSKSFWSLKNLNFGIVWNLVLGIWKLNNGLTLIEIIIVMALIAILATALWGNFFSSINKGRDSRRKQDLDAISKAVELYYNDNKSYPLPTLIVWGSAFKNPNNATVVYIQKVPTDPTSPSSSYCYNSDGSYYKIYANLENKDDPKIIPTVTCAPTPGVNFNYGISSPNVVP